MSYQGAVGLICLQPNPPEAWRGRSLLGGPAVRRVFTAVTRRNPHHVNRVFESGRRLWNCVRSVFLLAPPAQGLSFSTKSAI
jgi:hypothetical protein